MDTIREQVAIFMENNALLSKLENEKYYEMEDELVKLCEKVSGIKDNTYKTFKTLSEIVKDWVGTVADEDEQIDFWLEVIKLENKTFGSIMPLVNKYFGAWNIDGEIDGLAMELEEYFNDAIKFEEGK